MSLHHARLLAKPMAATIARPASESQIRSSTSQSSGSLWRGGPRQHGARPTATNWDQLVVGQPPGIPVAPGPAAAGRGWPTDQRDRGTPGAVVQLPLRTDPNRATVAQRLHRIPCRPAAGAARCSGRPRADSAALARSSHPGAVLAHDQLPSAAGGLVAQHLSPSAVRHASYAAACGSPSSATSISVMYSVGSSIPCEKCDPYFESVKVTEWWPRNRWSLGAKSSEWRAAISDARLWRATCGV